MSMANLPAFLISGLVVGASIAVPIGPMGLLCIQRTLASGMRAGVCTGLGAVTMNIVYGAAVLFGLMRLLPEGGRAVAMAGGVFLLWSALRTVRRTRGVGMPGAPTPGPAGCYVSAVAFGATNPTGLLLVLSLLSPLAEDGVAPGHAVLMLAGMALAAVTWWVSLSFVVDRLRSRLTPAMMTGVNRVAAAILGLNGLLALLHAAGR